jgi:hypothetical protein
VQLGVARVDQHTWAAAKARLAADAVAVAVEASSIERQMLLSVEQPLLLQALECLLGGDAAHAPSERLAELLYRAGDSSADLGRELGGLGEVERTYAPSLRTIELLV